MVDSTDYSARSKLEADVIDDTPDTYLVRYPDGSVGSVSKTSPDGLLCGIDGVEPYRPVVARGLARLEDEYVDEYGATGLDIEFELDFGDATGSITVEGHDSIQVTGNDLADLLLLVSDKLEDEDAVQTGLVLDRAEADQVFDIYEELITSRVRVDLIDEFADDYFGVSEVTDDGWIIHDAYLVTYEADNYLIDDIDTFHVSGGTVVQSDDTPQGVGLSFDSSPLGVLQTEGSASDVVLSAIEQEFLATVEILTNPGEHLGVDSFDKEVYNAVLEATRDIDRDLIERVADSATVTHYVDPKTGLLHRHEVSKHTLTDNFGVLPWVLNDMEYDSFDHAGVAELAWREDELRQAERDVFMDTDNDDDERWRRIQSVEKQAPCPPQVYRTLKGMYGTRGN